MTNSGQFGSSRAALSPALTPRADKPAAKPAATRPSSRYEYFLRPKTRAVRPGYSAALRASLSPRVKSALLGLGPRHLQGLLGLFEVLAVDVKLYLAELPYTD